jgi:hypothetical protein
MVLYCPDVDDVVARAEQVDAEERDRRLAE